MNLNVGWVERTVRLLIGVPMAVSYLYLRHFSEAWSYGLLGSGCALILTAIGAWCPVHCVLGTSTVKRPLSLQEQSSPSE